MRSWWTAWLQATRPPSSPLPSGGENGLAPALGTGQRGRPTRKAHEEGANAPPARRRVRPGGRTPRTLPALPARTACGGCFASFLTRRPYLLGPRSGHESGAGVARLPWWPVPGCDPPRTRSPTARTGGESSTLGSCTLGSPAPHRDFSRPSSGIGPCRTPPPNGNQRLSYVTDHGRIRGTAGWGRKPRKETESRLAASWVESGSEH